MESERAHPCTRLTSQASLQGWACLAALHMQWPQIHHQNLGAMMLNPEFYIFYYMLFRVQKRIQNKGKYRLRFCYNHKNTLSCILVILGETAKIKQKGTLIVSKDSPNSSDTFEFKESTRGVIYWRMNISQTWVFVHVYPGTLTRWSRTQEQLSIS